MDYFRWQQLMQKFQITPNKDTYNTLLDAYTEKHRQYHNTKHIDAVLKFLDRVSFLTVSPHEIEMALWFHDAIYKPLSKSNELDSAILASTFLAENNISNDVITRTHKLIMATLHTDEVRSLDESLMVDIDLTILGSPTKVYNQFEINIRKEYKTVPYSLYKEKRKAILYHFLGSDRIYQNEFFYVRFEKQARLNLSKVIKLL